MPLQTKAKSESTDKPWTLPPDRMRHIGCKFVRQWIIANKRLILEEVKIRPFCTVNPYVEEYDPFRTLSLICEWYDYCGRYDESKPKGIWYTVRYGPL